MPFVQSRAFKRLPGLQTPVLQTPHKLADLMARVAARDRSAFSELYQATSAKLLGIIIRILHRRDISEEVLQEVYVKIWNRASDFDPARASPIAWMAAIARNRALDEVRRVQPVSIEEAPEALELPDPSANISEEVERNEDLRRLLGCLDGLEPEKREIVLLAYYRGETREALAARFDRPVATIKTWLHRSLAQLRTCLGS